MSKIETFLQNCFLNSRATPKPGDQLDFLALEKKWAGKTSLTKVVEEAIRGVQGEDGKPVRIDEPLRDLTIKTYYFLTHISNYYSGLFTPYTKDKKFLRDIEEIWDILIKNTIFGGVYVGYGDDLIDLDKALIGSEDPDNAQLSCPFRLYSRQEKGKFYSILAAKPLKEKSGKLDSRLVKFWIRESNFWLEWWHLLTEFFGGVERVKMIAKAATVRTICSTDGGSQDFENEMEGLLSGLYPVMRRKGTTEKILEGSGEVATENEYTPHEFVPIDSPRKLLDFYVNYLDIFSDFLGYGGKASPHKMERLTEQEASQGSDVVATIQNFLQRRIQSCFDQMRKIYPGKIPEDFEITVSNRSTAQSILDPQEQNLLKEGKNVNIDG